MIDVKTHFLRAANKPRLAAFVLLGLMLSGCGGPKTLLISSPQLMQLKITPRVSSIALGQTVQFVATAIFNDGSSSDETKSAVWSSSNGGVACIDTKGHATSISTGSTTIVAHINGIVSSASLTISQAAMVAVTVAPSSSFLALGASVQLKAIGAFTDLSTHDVTDLMTWETSDPNIAAVSSTGLAASKSIGKVSITASAGSVNASSQLAVTAATLVSVSISQDRSTIPLGTAAQFSAQGVYSDGSTRDLTNSVSWSSSPQGVVSINSSGHTTGLKTGIATIDAKSAGVTGTSALTVSAAQLTSIAISSGKLTLPLGATQQMTATGAYTDGSTHDLTTSVAWSSVSGQIANISNGGIAVAKALGTTVISATASAIRGNTTINVTSPTLVAISISPLNPAVPLGRSLQLAATGSFTDGSVQDLTGSATWTVDSSSVVNLSNTGNATAQHVGTTGAEATVGSVESATTIVVQPIAAVSYFTTGPSGTDTTFRVTNPGEDESTLCAMVYVFDRDQQMAECCGCQISQDGLRTFSLNKDLTSNPLTGRMPASGSLLLVSADYTNNPPCDASSINPTGTAIAWATHLPTANSSIVSEESLSETTLSATLSSALQAQCNFVQQLGGGQGICSCGTGH
jgi:hypothetical protein